MMYYYEEKNFACFNYIDVAFYFLFRSFNIFSHREIKIRRKTISME